MVRLLDDVVHPAAENGELLNPLIWKLVLACAPCHVKGEWLRRIRAENSHVVLCCVPLGFTPWCQPHDVAFLRALEAKLQEFVSKQMAKEVIRSQADTSEILKLAMVSYVAEACEAITKEKHWLTDGSTSSPMQADAEGRLFPNAEDMTAEESEETVCDLLAEDFGDEMVMMAMPAATCRRLRERPGVGYDSVGVARRGLRCGGRRSTCTAEREQLDAQYASHQPLCCPPRSFTATWRRGISASKQVTCTTAANCPSNLDTHRSGLAEES